MKLIRSVFLAAMLATAGSAAHAQNYNSAFDAVMSPEARAANSQLQSGYYDTGSLGVQQRIMLGYFANPSMAKKLDRKVASGVKLTPGESYAYNVLTNARPLIDTLPRFGTPGYIYRPQNYGN